MVSRARDWFKQAVRDLEQAEASARTERHEWACFAAQQAAEKAVKALHLFHGQEAWMHVIARLLQDLPENILVPASLLDKAKVLDNFSIPARSPSSHPAGAPCEHYGPIQSEAAITYAGEIISFVRAQMAG